MPFYNPPYKVEQVYRANEVKEAIDWGLTLAGVPDVWKRSKGAGIPIAVLDTGIQVSHPDLKNQIQDAKDFTGSQFGVDDRVGHGTHCAGIIAAEENGVGVIGVAPKARLIIGKVLGDDGSGNGRDIAAGINWAREKGARIISMSLGSPFNDPYIANAIQRHTASGALFICAAGNDGQGTKHINHPGALKETLAVAAIDNMGRVAEYSSTGPEVDVAAPGSDVLSCYPPSGYAKLSGTSMATPFVAGVLGLAMGAGVLLEGIAQLRDLVKRTAKDGGIDGWDPSYGWGLINPGAMLPPEKPPEQVAPLETVLAENCIIDSIAGTLIFRRK